MRCGMRFTTYERREEMPLMVIKKDGHKEAFDRSKIMRGLVAATVKRDVSVETLEELIDEIVSTLRDDGLTEVDSQDLGKMVLQRLVDVDKVENGWQALDSGPMCASPLSIATLRMSTSLARSFGAWYHDSRAHHLTHRSP